MVSQTNEQALEAAIVQTLTGLTTEGIKQAGEVKAWAVTHYPG